MTFSDGIALSLCVIAALSRAIGLWDPSASLPATPPGSLALGELGRQLFTTWRRGGAWDEARAEREVLRVAEGSRDPSPISALRELVIDAWRMVVPKRVAAAYDDSAYDGSR